MTNPRRPLELNVGFLINAPIGTSRDFTFDYEKMWLGDDLTVADFTGKVIFTRTQQGLLMDGEFAARMLVDCVRCLEEYSQAVQWEVTDLYAFDERTMTESNLLLPEEGRIDLAPLLREYALLEVPIQPICKPECKGLCRECGENLNLVDCGHQGKGLDSPFSVLKDLLD